MNSGESLTIYNIITLPNIGHDLENIVGHITQDAALRFFGIFGISYTDTFPTTVQNFSFCEIS